jgi:hypothetical protein
VVLTRRYSCVELCCAARCTLAGYSARDVPRSGVVVTQMICKAMIFLLRLAGDVTSCISAYAPFRYRRVVEAPCSAEIAAKGTTPRRVTRLVSWSCCGSGGGETTAEMRDRRPANQPPAQRRTGGPGSRKQDAPKPGRKRSRRVYSFLCYPPLLSRAALFPRLSSAHTTHCPRSCQSRYFPAAAAASTPSWTDVSHPQ